MPFPVLTWLEFQTVSTLPTTESSLRTLWSPVPPPETPPPPPLLLLPALALDRGLLPDPAPPLEPFEPPAPATAPPSPPTPPPPLPERPLGSRPLKATTSDRLVESFLPDWPSLEEVSWSLPSLVSGWIGVDNVFLFLFSHTTHPSECPIPG